MRPIHSPYSRSLLDTKYLDYRDKSVIDIGCGRGDLCIMLAKTGAQKVVGVDLHQDKIGSP